MRQLQADPIQTQQMLELKSEEKADTMNISTNNRIRYKKGFLFTT
jgi:hypothetical protein